MKVQSWLFHALEDGHPEEPWQRRLSLSLQLLIVLNVAAVVYETSGVLPQHHVRGLVLFEHISLGIFTLEYLLRLVVCSQDVRFDPARGGSRFRHALRPMSIVDLLAVLPGLLPFFVALDLRMLRALRLLRLLRLFKLGRYSRALMRLSRALGAARAELYATLSAAGVVLLVASSVLYYAEHEAQPDVFGSIPMASWWAVVTLTTVGYGDATPVTVLGKIASAIVAMLGVGIIAVPAGVLADALRADRDRDAQRQQAAQQEHAGEPARCPHCGEDLPDRGPR